MPYGLKVAHHIDWVIHHLKAKLKQLLFYSQHLYQWCFWAKYLRTGLLEEIWFPPWLCCFLMLDEDDQVSKICFLLKVIKKKQYVKKYAIVQSVFQFPPGLIYDPLIYKLRILCVLYMSSLYRVGTHLSRDHFSGVRDSNANGNSHHYSTSPLFESLSEHSLPSGFWLETSSSAYTWIRNPLLSFSHPMISLRLQWRVGFQRVYVWKCIRSLFARIFLPFINPYPQVLVSVLSGMCTLASGIIALFEISLLICNGSSAMNSVCVSFNFVWLNTWVLSMGASSSMSSVEPFLL